MAGGSLRAALSSPTALPPSLPFAQALCEILLWPPPDWGWPSPGGGKIKSLPSHKRQAFAESHAIFNLSACFRNLVSVIASEASVCYGGSTNFEVFEIRSEKKKNKQASCS